MHLSDFLRRVPTFARRYFAAATAVIIALCPLHAQAQEADWKTNFVQAKTTAAQLQHYILLDFTGSDWCPWCVRMDKEVFSKAAFADFAAKHLVLVKLDYPRTKPQPAEEKAQNAELAKQFQIEGYPTYVLLDPSGKEVRRQVGYLQGGPAEFVRWTGLTNRAQRHLE